MLVIPQSKVLLLIAVLCLSAGAHGRSISMFGDVTIDISASKFICDKIECPSNTKRCAISKDKDPNDASILRRSNTCYSSTNEVLKTSVTEESIDPKLKVKVRIEANRNGGVVSSLNSFGSYTSREFDEDKFHKEFSKEMEHLQKKLNTEMDNLNEELSNMNREFSNIFG